MPVSCAQPGYTHFIIFASRSRVLHNREADLREPSHMRSRGHSPIFANLQPLRKELPQ